MAADAPAGELFATQPGAAPPEVVTINGRCALRTREGRRVVLVGGVPAHFYAVGDRAAEAYAAVMLVEQGFATQHEAARAFGCSTRTVRRSQQRFERGGLAALGRAPGYPRGQPRLLPARARRLDGLKEQGRSNREIAACLGVTEKAVRKALRRLGWKPAGGAEQPPLPLRGADPNVSASAAPSPPPPAEAAPDAPAATPAAADPNVSAPSTPPAASPAVAAPDAPAATPAGADPNLSAPPAAAPRASFDADGSDRTMDRLFAALGLLDDAAPLFQPGRNVPHAGVLLAVPALVRTGVLDCAREVYGSIGPAFYGLRTSILTLLLMALLRIKRPEALKEHDPAGLGRLLGLDRAPEVKTLRRKLTRLAAAGRAADLGRALAQRHVAAQPDALGFLYVDGHVRVYNGQREIPKAHVARMRLAMPATTDYWVNDAAGEPVFVVTAPANAGLTTMLPPVLAEMRRLVGERRVTVVFDRGGWSPKLFRRMIADGFDVLTYRKGRWRNLARRHFVERTGTRNGREVKYLLADRRVRLPGGGLLRQVVRLSDDGHQTPIITSRTDLSDVEVAVRMFDRWAQENFFKYLREEYALDALADHRAEPDAPDREVPNPRRKELEARLARLRERIRALCARHGFDDLFDRPGLHAAARGLRASRAPDVDELLDAVQQHMALQARCDRTPRRVPVRDTVEGPVVRLAVERKHLTNVLKMAAYRAETELSRLVAPHYARADDEGRTLVQSALCAAADLEPTQSELIVTLAPLSSPHRSRALAALCDELNRSPVRFPGSDLLLRFRPRPPDSPAEPPKRTV